MIILIYVLRVWYNTIPTINFYLFIFLQVSKFEINWHVDAFMADAFPGHYD